MPIEDALVEVYKDGELWASGLTDSTGRWSCTLVAGSYTIIISKTGYQTITKSETVGFNTELIVNLPTAAPGGVWVIIEDWVALNFVPVLDDTDADMAESEDFSPTLWRTIAVT
mgnify:CR=1 FL=1